MPKSVDMSQRPYAGCESLLSLAFRVMKNNFPGASNYIKIAFALNKNYA